MSGSGLEVGSAELPVVHDISSPVVDQVARQPDDWNGHIESQEEGEDEFEAHCGELEGFQGNLGSSERFEGRKMGR